ncbi:MAG: HAD-IA family hydrolase [Chloroflexi bacterium]|nr:HAD-IA family hydrolase [Chloroflexota bacterium]
MERTARVHDKKKIIDAFDTVIISAEVGVVKPKTKIYEIALQRANVSAEDSVFLDDVYENIQSCEKVGMKGILFKEPEKSMRDLKRWVGR